MILCNYLLPYHYLLPFWLLACPWTGQEEKAHACKQGPPWTCIFSFRYFFCASLRLFRLTTSSHIGCPYYICKALSLENPCFSSLTGRNYFHAEWHQMCSWPSILSPAWALMGASCSTAFSHNTLPGCSCQGHRYFLSQKLSALLFLIAADRCIVHGFIWSLFNLNPKTSCISELYSLIMCSVRKYFLCFLNLLSDNYIGYTFILYLEAGYSNKIEFNGIQSELKVYHADSITCLGPICYRLLKILNLLKNILQSLKCIYFEVENDSTARHWQ